MRVLRARSFSYEFLYLLYAIDLILIKLKLRVLIAYLLNTINFLEHITY